VPNDTLRRALAEAKLNERQLADKVGADPKTVSRWCADENRLPHPRLRWAVADALGVDEVTIWPAAARAVLKTGPDRELVSAYPFRSQVSTSLWRSLLAGAHADVTVCAYTAYFLWLEQANLGRLLRAKAEDGTRVRFLLGNPDSEATRQREQVENVPLTVSTRIRVSLDELGKLRDAPGVESRFAADEPRHLGVSVFRFDEQAIVCQHIADRVGHDSPTLHLRRRQDDGLFDRFAVHVDTMWEAAAPVWP
jgi:transcriptional regulator with XRE-family HTH domain